MRLRSPMMRIHTVAAGGGGSIIHYKGGGRFRVGPDSAGSDPGPACYRKGGPLTVTDCNLMLGKLQPDFFPGFLAQRQTSLWIPKLCAENLKSLLKQFLQTGIP